PHGLHTARFDTTAPATYHCRSHGRPHRVPDLVPLGAPSNAICKGTLNMLHYLQRSFTAFLVDEDGPTAVEYAVMLALIIVVCLAAIAFIGTRASGTFSQVGGSLPAPS